jgi:hypothetical protein
MRSQGLSIRRRNNTDMCAASSIFQGAVLKSTADNASAGGLEYHRAIHEGITRTTL